MTTSSTKGAVVTTADAYRLIPSPDKMPGRTVHERVREALRASVLDGTLAADSRLRQVEIADRLGVSVTPVREALRDLAADGLVKLDAHRGAIVASMSLEEFVEIRLLMEALEPVWAALVVRNITDEELERATRLQERMTLHPDEYLEINGEFHDLLTAAARAPRLLSMLGALRASSAAVVRRAVGHDPERVNHGIKEHWPLLDGLRARDPDAVSTAILDHLRPTWDLVERIMRESEGGDAPASV